MWLTLRTVSAARRDARLVRPLKRLRVYVSIHFERTHNPCVPTYQPCRFHLIIYIGWSGHGAFWGLLFGGRYFSGASMSACLSSFQNGSMDEI